MSKPLFFSPLRNVDTSLILCAANFSFRTIRYDRKEVLSGVYDGNEVTVFAHVSPGGYEMILGELIILP